VTKCYHAPATPYQRLIDSASIPESTKEQLRVQFLSLDPIRLLGKIRRAQSRLVALEGNAGDAEIHSEQTTPTPSKAEFIREQRAFVAGLRTAWREAEVRPTHQKRPRAPRNWRTRRDPFEATWPLLKTQLENSPGTTAKELSSDSRKNSLTSSQMVSSERCSDASKTTGQRLCRADPVLDHERVGRSRITLSGFVGRRKENSWAKGKTRLRRPSHSVLSAGSHPPTQLSNQARQPRIHS